MHKFGCVPYTRRVGGGGQAQIRKKNCLSPCPGRGSNPGSSDLNSDALPTELRPHFEVGGGGGGGGGVGGKLPP